MNWNGPPIKYGNFAISPLMYNRTLVIFLLSIKQYIIYCYVILKLKNTELNFLCIPWPSSIWFEFFLHFVSFIISKCFMGFVNFVCLYTKGQLSFVHFNLIFKFHNIYLNFSRKMNN